MPRLRPQRLFAAAIVTVAGCGRLYDAPPDAPPDAEIDCDENPYEGNCNPPPADAAPPPVTCAPDGLYCTECAPGAPLLVEDSTCVADVCAIDPTCCATIWDERCVDLADARCEGLRCGGTVGVGGAESLAFATWTGSGFDLSVETGLGHGHWWSVAWGAIPAAVHLDAANILEPSPGSYPPPDTTGGALDGRRVRWADLDHDRTRDLVVSGGRGAYWTDRYASYPIVPPADGMIGDLALADVDGDAWVDAIVGFVGGQGTWIYRGWVTGFSRESAAIAPDALTLELCDLDGDGARDLMLVEPDRIAGIALTDRAAIFPAVLGTFADAACGDLDGDGHDEIVATQDGGAVVVLADGAIVWTAPETLRGSGVDTGDLDDDGDVDLVISETGADARIHVYWNRAEAPLAFDHLEGPILGDDLGRLDLTR